jgi:hypothetical protein
MYLNIIKAIYDKPLANIILNREKLKPFLLNSRMSHKCHSCHIGLKFLAREIRLEEEIKIIQIGK